MARIGQTTLRQDWIEKINIVGLLNVFQLHEPFATLIYQVVYFLHLIYRFNMWHFVKKNPQQSDKLLNYHRITFASLVPLDGAFQIAKLSLKKNLGWDKVFVCRLHWVISYYTSVEQTDKSLDSIYNLRPFVSRDK